MVDAATEASQNDCDEPGPYDVPEIRVITRLVSHPRCTVAWRYRPYPPGSRTPL